jgi:hypothetical protein
MQISIGMVERTNKVNFPYVRFIGWQILGTMESHIKIEKNFNIANTCINLQCSHLSMDNLEMFINIYNN